jgi:hypothetical protein
VVTPVCLKPDDGSNNVWVVANSDDAVIAVSFLNTRSSFKEMQHHEVPSHLGVSYWPSNFSSVIAIKWLEFLEVNE